MPLVNLTTNLKSLKFGNDQPGGGSSNQPYIQTSIPEGDTNSFNASIDNTGDLSTFQLGAISAAGGYAGAGIGAAIGSFSGTTGAGALIGLGLGVGTALYALDSSGQIDISANIPSTGTGGPDFVVRGGQLVSKIIANDVTRLTKYFADTKSWRGIGFAIKQNLLSKAAVRTQTSEGGLTFNERLYTPISTVAQAGVNAFGYHLNKQGLLPYEKTGAYATNNENLYGVKVNQRQEVEENRLAALLKVKMLQIKPDKTPKGLKGFYTDDDNEILSYIGGPDAPLLGKTNIRFANQRTGDAASLIGIDIYGSTVDTYSQVGLIEIPENIKDGPQTLTGISSYIGRLGTTIPGDFRAALRTNTTNPDEIGNLINAPSYLTDNIEQRVGLGDPGNRNGKDLSSYVNGWGGGAASGNSFDQVNAFPIYLYNSADPVVTDLVTFRIGVMYNENPSLKFYLHFRAFLDQISDQYAADWDSTQYIGRGEKFYNYKGFDRKVSLSWTVAAQSKIELIPMYKKLNFLASVCAPDYSANGYMRGNIVTLTVGGYFYEQPGIITGFTYEMNDENATWEIGIENRGNSFGVPKDKSVKQLPHMIKVTGFQFIPIHKFVPKLQNIDFPEGDDPATFSNDTNTYGPERYIALADDDDIISNYGLDQAAIRAAKEAETAARDTRARQSSQFVPPGPGDAGDLPGFNGTSGGSSVSVDDLFGTTSNTPQLAFPPSDQPQDKPKNPKANKKTKPKQTIKQNTGQTVNGKPLPPGAIPIKP